MYEIFWQAPGWPAFPAGYQSKIEQWVRDVAADDGKTSNPFAAITQYFDGSGPGNYNVHFGGSALVHAAPDSPQCSHGSICVSIQSIIDEIDAYRLSLGLPTGVGSNQFGIILPPGVTT
ncbi:MAG TPA: hypothetical protein VIE38_07310, partial [Gaiellaceae bacterium]